MDEQLMEKLRPITTEEQKILDGRDGVDKELYTRAGDFTVSSDKLLEKGRRMDIRAHTRFVHFPKHRHNYIEIIYMCAGQLTHVVDGASTVVLKQGDLLFLNQHAFHEILPAGEGDLAVNFIILPEFFDVAFQMIDKDSVIGRFLVSTLCQEDSGGQYLYFSAASILPVQNLMENLVWSLVNRRDDGRVNQYTMGLVFMHLLDRADLIGSGSLDQYQNRLVFTSLKYIEDHYRDASLTELAKNLNQSVFRLSRLLQSATGNGFKELLQQKRMQRACQLLTDTGLPVSDIIHAVGYDNTSYFYRVFREDQGVSPREYRLRLLQKRT